MTKLLVAHVVKQAQGTPPPGLEPTLDPVAGQLRNAGLPMADALLLMTGRLPAKDATSVLEQVRAETPTIDRALTLPWTYRALGGAASKEADDVLRAAISRIEVDPPWQSLETVTGQRVYRWTEGSVPTSVRLAAAPAAGVTVIAQFDSREPETTSLPVRVERRIYRLVRSDTVVPAAQRDERPRRGQAAPEVSTEATTFALELLAPDAVLRTDEVYLDEVVLTRTAGATLRYGIVEVPLPPGATADRTTWGIAVRFPGAGAAEALERARYEQTPRGYAVPVDALAGDVVVRHLVRVAQTGKFALPPVRYYRMYQPEQKAFEENARAQLDIR
jgi:uncharacterized protein YfaS (alpha-2-macroglobulin family)